MTYLQMSLCFHIFSGQRHSFKEEYNLSISQERQSWMSNFVHMKATRSKCENMRGFFGMLFFSRKVAPLLWSLDTCYKALFSFYATTLVAHCKKIVKKWVLFDSTKHMNTFSCYSKGGFLVVLFLGLSSNSTVRTVKDRLRRNR